EARQPCGRVALRVVERRNEVVSEAGVQRQSPCDLPVVLNVELVLAEARPPNRVGLGFGVVLEIAEQDVGNGVTRRAGGGRIERDGAFAAHVRVLILSRASDLRSGFEGMGAKDAAEIVAPCE